MRADSHREAAEQLALVREHGAPMGDAERVAVLEECSEQAYHAGQPDRALAMPREAVAIRRTLGDPRATSASLRWLSRIPWWTRDRAGAEAAGDEAAALVRDGPPTRELAMAESNLYQLHMLTQRDEEAVARGRHAMALAERLGDVETLVHAKTNVGTSIMRTRFDEGHALPEDAARQAMEAG
ncbi:MAG: hypothetical protein ACK4OJ_07915, partial [Brevundimonas sp.]